MDQHKSKMQNFNNDLWGHHFLVDQSIGNQFVNGNNRRVICTLNSEVSFHCALMPYGNGGYFINVNKEIRDKLKIQTGSLITFSLTKDDSEYGMPLPEELNELWTIDDEGFKYFHKLTPGKQRTLIYIIGKPKSSVIRLNKAIAINEYLKSVRGKLDFKELNAYIKDFNKL